MPSLEPYYQNLLKPGIVPDQEHLNSISHTFFGVDVNQAMKQYSQEAIYAQITELKAKILELYSRLNSQIRIEDIALSVEVVNGYAEMFPFLTGIDSKSDMEHYLHLTKIPMELLLGDFQRPDLNMGVVFSTPPLYSYTLGFGPGQLRFQVKTSVQSNYEFQNYLLGVHRRRTSSSTRNYSSSWIRRSDSSFAHPHVSGGATSFTQFCRGTNRFDEMITRSKIKTVGDFSAFIFGALLWVKSYNLEDSYGGFASPPFQEYDDGCRTECRFVQSLCSRIVKELGAELRRSLQGRGRIRPDSFSLPSLTPLMFALAEECASLRRKWDSDYPVTQENASLAILEMLLQIITGPSTQSPPVVEFGKALYLWEAAYAILLLSCPAGLSSRLTTESVRNQLRESVITAGTLVNRAYENDEPECLLLDRYPDFIRVLDGPKALQWNGAPEETKNLFRVDY